MFRRALPVVLALACPPAPPAALGQSADEDDREKIQVPEVPDASGKRPDLARAAGLITDRTNGFRKDQGRGPVKADAELTEAARYFAGYMARTDEYGHAADGSRPADRAKKHGYDYCIVLENIAYAFDSRGFDTDPLAGQFFTGWKESPGHRRNMLDPDVTETGVAVARSDKTGYYYAVQMFGRPKSAAVEFRIDNRAGEAVEYAIGDKTFTLPPRYVRTHTRCRPAELTFRWPGGKTEAVEPADGGRLTVTKDGGGFAVRAEKE